MKAVILVRKFKSPRNIVFYNFISLLIHNGFSVKVIPYSQWKVMEADLLIQWSFKRHQREWADMFRKRNKKMKSIFIDYGWIDRDKNILLYDYKAKKIPTFKRDIEVSQFVKPIIRHANKVWIIFLQVPGDGNLINCSNYKKWANDVSYFMSKNAKLPVVFRKHPKQKKNFLDLGKVEYSKETLDVDLGRAIGTITWNSSAILKAMTHNIPSCAYDFPELGAQVPSELEENWIYRVERELENVDYLDALKGAIGRQIPIDEITCLNINYIVEHLDG